MSDYFTSPQGRRLAFRRSSGAPGKPTFVWLAGFNSDMAGTKVTETEAWAKQRAYGFLAFDYSGHGLSGGEFTAGTISAWREDALAVIDEMSDGPLILVGSSMGGWLACLAGLARPARVRAMILIAPAPDFTEKLMWPGFTPDQQAEIMENGVFIQPSNYGDPYPITRALIEDGRKWQILDDPIKLDMPVRILHGMRDSDVPWQHALRLNSALTTDDLVLTLIKDGDHRLSRAQDIKHLLGSCEEIALALNK